MAERPVPRKVIPVEVQVASRVKVESIGYAQEVQALMERMNRTLSMVGPWDTVPELVRRFYEQLEPLLQRVKPISACGGGCSHCCSIPVTVTAGEAAVIAEATGRSPVKLAAKQAKQGKPKGFSPCPFLKAGQCSIYPQRPLMCRIQFAIEDTDEWCRLEVRHAVAYLDRRPLEALFASFLQMVERACAQPGRPALLTHIQDIRQWFPGKA